MWAISGFIPTQFLIGVTNNFIRGFYISHECKKEGW